MAKITMVFGVLLMVLSAVAFALLHHGHALIPGGFGLLLVILGGLARTEDTKRRMLLMHVAVTIGLLGFLGTIPGFIGVVKLALGQPVIRPDAAYVQAAMGTICFVFVALCVRSFVAARRTRTA